MGSSRPGDSRPEATLADDATTPRVELGRAPTTPSPPPSHQVRSNSPELSDIEKAQARARLKARLFQIEAEPLKVGRFSVLSSVGQGGMGAVYAAYDEQLDRKVAIKVMLPDVAGSTEAARDRMRREAQAMARLSHPNIVAVHEVGEVDDQVFIAMEFVRGQSIDAWISHKARPWTEVLEAYCAAGRGLHAAHEAGLVHRDFKPQNVMVGEDGTVKVLDFGLARDERLGADRAVAVPRAPAAEEPSLFRRSLTNTGAIVGTPAYMSPEQHHGEPLTSRSDQFSFCVALYTGLYGEHPFPLDSLDALVEAVSEGRVREPSGTAVPTWLRRVLLRGLAVDPGDRFGSMAALLEALTVDPGARRRRRLLVITAVAAIFAGGFAVAQLGGVEGRRCPDPRKVLREDWGDARRERVAAAIRASGSPRAEDTWARVAPALDAYAERWIEAREAACRDHRAGQSTGLLHARRVACLEHGRAGLSGLLEVLEAADAVVVDKAVTAAAGLPPLSRCEDVEALLLGIAPPPDAVAPEVAALREKLARARVNADAGRIAPALRMIDEVLTRAEAVGYPPLQAEALLRRGSGQLAAGDGAAADQSLGDAVWLAVASGHDAVAAEAAAHRLLARSELLGRPAEAAIELPWAQALVARVGDEVVRGLLLNNAAAVYLRNGEHERSQALYREALAVRRASLPPEHPEISQTLANLGRAERDLQHYGKSVQALREAAQATAAVLGPRHPQRASIAVILGTALMEQGRHGEAEAELALAAAIYGEGPGMSPYYVRQAQGELALRRRGWAEAQRHFELALARAEPQVGSEHPMLADVRLGLAEARAAQGRQQEGEALARETIARLSAKLGATHSYVGAAWARLGRLLLRSRAPARAEGSFARALEIERAASPPDPQGVAWVERGLGRAWLAQGRTIEAEAVLRRSLETFEASPQLDDTVRAEAERWLAQALLAGGQPLEAEQRLARAEAILASLREPDDPDLAWLRFGLAVARHDAATEPDARAEARTQARRVRVVLEDDPAWAHELAQVITWLGSADRPEHPG